MNIKDLVSNGKKVNFQFYKQGELWYKTDDGFEFPVPIKDVGDGIFMAQDKAILYMRYIRIHLENIQQGKQECENV